MKKVIHLISILLFVGCMTDTKETIDIVITPGTYLSSITINTSTLTIESNYTADKIYFTSAYINSELMEESKGSYNIENQKLIYNNNQYRDFAFNITGEWESRYQLPDTIINITDSSYQLYMDADLELNLSGQWITFKAIE